MPPHFTQGKSQSPYEVLQGPTWSALPCPYQPQPGSHVPGTHQACSGFCSSCIFLLDLLSSLVLISILSRACPDHPISYCRLTSLHTPDSLPCPFSFFHHSYPFLMCHLLHWFVVCIAPPCPQLDYKVCENRDLCCVSWCIPSAQKSAGYFVGTLKIFVE